MTLTPETIHGFNYQPSYGSNGLELWRRFDAATIRREIGLGRKHFPRMNALRFWLSWDAYSRDPKRFLADFETALAIFAEFGLPVMPVLFNRWHNTRLDYGGVYVDHFLGYQEGVVNEPELFDDYVHQVVGAHARDPRVFCWDLCNEPNPVRRFPEIEAIEMDWLSIHPYLMQDTPENRRRFQEMLDDYVAVARQAGKPLIATETCWGSLSDEARVRNARFNLAELKQRNIGWLVYLLHHSLVADAHRPEFGPVGGPGNLAFIEADGSLRPGHDFFNDYC